MANGHNPMRWDCERRGCFNKHRRPKIEVFHDCFPGKISFGDVDAIVEINGYGLILEWKTDCDTLPTGQRIMYRRLTKDKTLSVIVVCGDAETMEVEAVSTVFAGEINPFQSCDLAGLKRGIAWWVKKAQGGCL